ncbi:MAG: hypothetical protein IIA45_12820 [Bacteroidetes bacterium]|nr:hypothetical protein [Bacteroidota bacterium]
MKPYYSSFLLFLLLLFATTLIHGQGKWTIGTSTGVTHYYGDVGHQKVFPNTSANTGTSVILRHHLNNPGSTHPPYFWEARFSLFRLAYDEVQPIGSDAGFQLRNYGRGINFRNDLLTASVHWGYSFYASNNPHIVPFATVGTGIFHMQPKADLFMGSININNRYYAWSDGSLRDGPESLGSGKVVGRDGKYETKLNEWYTEGQKVKKTNEYGKGKKYPYSLTQAVLPLSVGMRYKVNPKLDLILEYSYWITLTDFVDDVSDRYATDIELQQNFTSDPAKQQLARYISDPSGWGTDGTNGPATSRRGNVATNDMFSYLSLELAYKFDPSKFASKKLKNTCRKLF